MVKEFAAEECIDSSWTNTKPLKIFHTEVTFFFGIRLIYELYLQNAQNWKSSGHSWLLEILVK